MIRRQSFWTWLMAQRHRNDPVGDLARDAEGDEQLGAMAPYNRAPVPHRHLRFRAHVRQLGCDDAQAAVDVAINEWRLSNRGGEGRG